MDVSPKTYIETKSRALLQGLIVFIPLILMILNEIFFKQNDSIFVHYLIWFIIAFVIFFVFVVYIIPTGKLEISSKGFVYRKGKFLLSANWSEVNTIAFQINRGKYSTRRTPTAFAIDTDRGITKFIDTKILKSKESGQYIDLVQFVSELESVSSKTIKWGETSTKKYSEVGFLDYLKEM